MRVAHHTIWIALATIVLLSVGCQSGGNRPAPRGGTADGSVDPTEDTLSDLDLGADWDVYEQRLAARNTTGGASAASPTLTGGNAAGGSGFSIVLATFGGTSHREEAEQYRPVSYTHLRAHET